MKIRYCIVTLNQFSWVIDKHLPSVSSNLVDGVHLLVSEVQEQAYNGLKFSDPTEVKEAEAQIGRFKHWKVASSLNNYGVANAWNLFAEEAKKDGYDAIIVANDDIYIYDGVLERFIEAMQTNEFVCFAGQNAFSFFGIHLSTYEAVGGFDENFWPAYFEDNDFHYRMKLLNIPTTAVEEPSYYHRVSATLNAFDYERRMMHHHNFRKNTAYYMKKWGGMPHEERYTKPFGDQDTSDH